MRILGIIPARGGSKGVPGKNIKILVDKPLIAYTIQAANNAKLLTDVVLSSDDNDIINCAKNYKIQIPFKRPKELATDESPTILTVVHALNFFKNMEGEDFLQLLQNSLCLIGNSSVGIRECAYLGVPVINIGSRQNRREQAENVINVNYCQEKIEEAIITALDKGKSIPSTIYGEGNSGEKIAELLGELPLQFHKTIMY